VHRINIRIVISTQIKRLIMQLKVSKVSYKNGNFQVFFDYLKTTVCLLAVVAATAWKSTGAEKSA
jgi:hypothetical protein